RLAAGGARGQAVIVRAFKLEVAGNMAGRRVQLLLVLAAGVIIVQGARRKAPGIEATRFFLIRTGHGSDMILKIRLPLARAEIDSEARAVSLCRAQQTAVFERLLAGSQGKARVRARVRPALGPRHMATQIKALH